MRKLIVTLMLAGAWTLPAHAAHVYWTDWTSATTSQVIGTLPSVEVTYTGPILFAQTSGGTNYWSPAAPYLSALVDNAPPPADIIALYAGGEKTILFSEAVHDPFIALVSWNTNVVDFGVPIQIVSSGPGYFGSGYFVLNSAGTGFTGYNEVHGVIRLPGSHTSITFTDTSELWHGFTVGVVPEPETYAMMLAGLGLLAFAVRRR